MRFLVPIVPLFCIAAAWAMAQMVKAAPRSVRVAVPVAVLALQLLMYGSTMIGELRQMKQREIPLAMATQGLEKVASDGDVVIASNGFLQNLDFVRKWKLADVSVATGRGGPGGGMGGGPGGGFGRDRFAGGDRFNGPPDDDIADRPSPMQQAKLAARAKLYSGSTEQREDQFMADVEKWAGRRAIYAIGSAAEIENLLPGTSKAQRQVVSRIKTPAAPPEVADARGRMSGPRGGFVRGGFGGPGGGPAMGGRGGPGGPGGMFGPAIAPGEEILIVRYHP
jgi:hypothetical protein